MTGLITITAENVQKHGFFCKMSARKTPAWQAKRDWLIERFAEGMQMRLLGDGERGFVEFMPGAKAWRAVEDAEDFLLIHCLWVVGKSKGKGLSNLLLSEVETQAKALGYRGVAALASTGNWLTSPQYFAHHGYETLETEGPHHLVAKAFAPGPAPRLCGDWDAKAARCGPGLTVLRTPQCPYLDDATRLVRETAAEIGLPFHEAPLTSAADIRARAPTPYGTYAVVKDGKLTATHYLTKKQLLKTLN